MIFYEKHILSALIFKPDLIYTYGLEETYFSSIESRNIFKAIYEIYNLNRVVDYESIIQHAQKENINITIDSLLELGTTGIHDIDKYIQELFTAYRLKRIDLLSIKIKEWLKNKPDNEIILEIEKELIDIALKRQNLSLYELNGCLLSTITMLEEAYKAGITDATVKTGLTSIDNALGGFTAGEYIIIGARPGIGKTTLAISMILNIAKRRQKVGLFSLEMKKEHIIAKMIAQRNNLNLQRIIKGGISNVDLVKITDGCNELYGLQILICDQAAIRLHELKSLARKMVLSGCKIIFIDYLTLISFTDKNMNRPERVGFISKQLKAMAGELNIPVVVLSQVARSAEDKMPTLNELRQSGEIEEDADIVLFLHRKRNSDEMEVSVAKNRFGTASNFVLE